MQLFWWDFDLEKCFSKDAKIFHQIKNVLRTKIWDKFLIHDEKTNCRFLVQTTSLEKFFWFKILEKISNPENQKNIILVIWMLNKFEKIEFLVQKISEIWINQIIFFDWDRSQIHELSQKKLQRLNTISREAVEQSKGRIMPKISFEKKLQNLVWLQWEKFVLEFDWKNIFDINNNSYRKILFVWPEWGFSPAELKIFEDKKIEKISLWENIFRAETAAILWSYILKNIN